MMTKKQKIHLLKGIQAGLDVAEILMAVQSGWISAAFGVAEIWGFIHRIKSGLTPKEVAKLRFLYFTKDKEAIQLFEKLHGFDLAAGKI